MGAKSSSLTILQKNPNICIAKTGNETLTVDVKETEAQTSCLFCMDDFSNFEGGGEWLR